MFPVLCTPSLSERVSSHYPNANWKEKFISGIGMVPDGLVFYLLIFFLIIAIVLVIYKSGMSIKYIFFPLICVKITSCIPSKFRLHLNWYSLCSFVHYCPFGFVNYKSSTLYDNKVLSQHKKAMLTKSKLKHSVCCLIMIPCMILIVYFIILSIYTFGNV